MKKKNIIHASFVFIGLVLLASFISNDQTGVTIVDKPNNQLQNSFYLNNAAPLIQNSFLKLPVTAIQPKGWLKEMLVRQKDGLTGHLGEISAWLQKDNNAWLSKDGAGGFGWEELPYWLKGYGNLAYILKDPAMIVETKVWLEGVFSSQKPDGNFGPINIKKDVEDFWPKMIMLYCLQSYYEYAGDKRVISLMQNFFRYQLNYPEDKFLQMYWQGLRAGDNLYSVLWLYNHTHEAWLLDLANKIHKKGKSWSSRNTPTKSNNHSRHNGKDWPKWYNELPDWHNVNVSQGFREPATFYQLSHNEKDLKASYEVFDIVRKYFGQVPGGLFGSDEVARPGYDDPRQGMETCGMVEEMNSDEHMMRMTGDIAWADQAENVAFNSYPASVMSDFKSLRYITSPNMVLNDAENHSPGIDNAGPFLMMNPFSSRCCQHNHAQGWPYFSENLFMATPDNGAAAVIYSASEVAMKVGNGTNISIDEKTNYPFEDKISFVFHTKTAVAFPFYLRIPQWCNNASISVNQHKVAVQPMASKYVRINRTWKEGDVITLQLPMQVQLKEWKENKNSVSVNYGPLTFSLKIGEEYIKAKSDATAIGDSKWQKGADIDAWPSYEIHPSSAWNYGLVFDQKNISNSFSIEKKPWPKDNFPFTQSACPIIIKTKAQQIPNWKIDQYGLCGVLSMSPIKSKSSVETVTLLPMGAARLRISAFPVIGKGANALDWKN